MARHPTPWPKQTAKQQAVRAALMHLRSQGLSDRAIANHVGVDHKTILTWDQNLSYLGKFPR